MRPSINDLMKRAAAGSYDEKFKKEMSNNIFDKYSQRESFDFDLTNQDYLKGDENPYTYNMGLNENAEDPFNEIRATNQSGVEQLGLGLVRATNKAATEVAKLAPIVYGVGKAIFEDNETSALEDIFNNEGIKALDEMSQKINTDYLPVYVKDSVKNGTLMDNLLSTSFYATEGADGIGFMASMFAPGMLLSKLSLGSKLIGAMSKSSKMAKMLETTNGGMKALGKLGWTARDIDSKVSVLFNSMIEAGAESKGTQDALNGEKLNEIELYKSKGLSQEQAEEIFNQKHPDWDNQVASAMKGDFWMQMPMLLGTGSMMHKAIFGKALDKVEKTVEYGLKGRVGSMTKQWGKATLSEGFIEEAGQSTLENYYTKKAYEGKLGKGLIGDVNIGDLTKEYINTVSSVEGGKAIFLGALMGGPFMSMEARREHLKGLKDTNSITNGVKSSIDDYNTIKENDIYETDPKDPTKPLFKKDENGNITSEKIINREKALKVAESLKNIEDDDALYDEAIKSDDIELQKFIQNRNILKLIAPAIQNGKLGLQILKEELEQALKFTDISEADKNSKDENNTNKKLVETILAKAEHLQKQNEKFKDFSPDIIKLDDPRTTKELNEEYLNHLNSKYIETKSLQYDAENNLKELNKKRDNILDELGLDKGLQIEDEIATNKEQSSSLLKQVSDKIRETEKEVSKYKKDINELWENKDLINKSFKSYINEKEKKQKQTSEENVQKTDEINSNIKSATTVEELDKIKPNEYTAQQFNQKREELEKGKIIERENEIAEIIPSTQVKQVLKSEREELTDHMTNERYSVYEGNPIEFINKDSDGNLLYKTKNGQKILFVDKINKIEETTVDDIVEGSANDFKVVDPKIVSDGTVKDDGKSPGSVKGNKQYADYLLESRDKTGDTVTFTVNRSQFVKDKDSLEAIKLYDKLLKDEKFSATNEQLEYLIKHLPIQFNYNNGSSSFSSHGGTLNSKLRTSIINALQSGIKLENIQSVVTNQANADFNNQIVDNKPAVNNVLDIAEFNGDTKNLVLYHINTDGKFIVVSEKQEDFQGSHKVNTDLSGNIFVVMSHPKGYKVAAKLNSNKLNIKQSEGLALLYKELTKSKNTEIREQVLDNLEDDEINNYVKSKILNLLSNEIKLLGGNPNNISIDEMIKLLVLENSSKDSNKSIEIGIDENGNQTVKFNNSEYNLENGIENFVKDLTENKKQNVITIETDATKVGDKGITFKNQAYLKYLFDNRIVSTDINTNPEEGNFKTASSATEQGSEVYIRSAVESKNTTAVFVNQKTEIKRQSELEAKKADIEEDKFNREFSQTIDQINNFFTNTLGLSIKFDGSGRRKLDNGKEVVTYEITIYQNGKAIGNTGFKIVNGKIEISLTEINEELQGKGIASVLYQDINNALQQLGYGVLHSDTTFLEDSRKQKTFLIVDGKELSLDETSEFLLSLEDPLEDLEKLKEEGRVQEIKKVKPGEKLWQSLERKGLAEKLENGQYRFINTKYDAELKVLESENNSENIRNNENNSVSLPNNVKIENEMDIPNTQANVDYKEAIDKIISDNKMTVDLQKNIDILAKNIEMRDSEDFKTKSEKVQSKILENIKKANIEMPQLIKNCG